MKKLILFVVSIFSIFFVTGCITPASQPTKSPLELQAIQIREFDCDKDNAYTALISVFQDLGYVVETVDNKTGLVIAKTPSRAETVFGKGTITTYAKATGFVEQIAENRTKVRISFVNSELQTIYGMQGTNDTVIEDPEAYQKAFTLLRNSLFVRNNTH